MIKKLFDKISIKVLCNITLFIVLANIIFDIDHVFYGALNSIGLPRPSTIIKFIIIPILLLIMFIKLENNKRKVIPIFIIYFVVLGIYFVIHCAIANNEVETLELTNNFFFSISKEFFNVATLIMPLLFMYVVFKLDYSEDYFMKTCLFSSLIISVPIIITDLFCCGLSTYGGTTQGNIFSWFKVPLSELEDVRPQYFTSKFFFSEGNTVGILLFCILPLLYYFIYKYRKETKQFILWVIVTFLHSVAMIMLGTRIATLGAFLVPTMMFVLLVMLSILKKEEWSIKFFIVTVIMATVFVSIYRYTPCYQNQLVDHSSDIDLRHATTEQSDYISTAKGEYQKLINDDKVYDHALIYMFEQYSWMIKNTPQQYYMDYYNYKFDPAFWLSYIFDYEFDQRVTGRQTEMIFQQYKWDKVGTKEHLFGLGYSTFMNGSIIIERDFVQQFMSYGYFGFILLCCPWIIVSLFLAIKIIIGYKKHWSMINITALACIFMGLASAFISSHTLDQYMTSFFIALLCSFLLRKITIFDREKMIQNEYYVN